MPRPGKTYVTLEDDMNLNPKVRGVSLAARWAYVSSICYSGRTLSDGRIPKADLGLVDATPAVARELVAAKLWDLDEKRGWIVHDYLEHNRSRAQVDEAKTRARENGAKGLASRYANGLASSYQKQAENAGELPSIRAISVISDHPVDSSEERTEVTDTGAGKSPSKSPAPHKPVDEEFLTELQSLNPSVNVRAIYERAQNRKTWDGYKDKRRALRDHIGYALNESGGTSGNRNGHRTNRQPNVTVARDAAGPGRTPDLVG